MAPLLALDSKSASLSAGIHMSVQAVWCEFFPSGLFLLYFSMLILSLPLLGLGPKSTSLNPGFCVCRSRQYNRICLELNLISGFFAFFWLIVLASGINKCGWCLAGGRRCWFKGLHQIASASLIYHHSLHFHIYQIPSFVPGILCPLYYYYKWWEDGIGGGVVNLEESVGGKTGGGYYLLAFIYLFFFTCALVLFSLRPSVPLF